MADIKNTQSEGHFWSQRYSEQKTGWDIGYPSTPLKTYFDQLKNKDQRILIPGAGNAYEAGYLFKIGFQNVFVLDISAAPLEAFKERNPDFPQSQLLHENFFDHNGKYDLILEQTFFCSFPPLPENRKLYFNQMAQLLKKNGKLVGLWFDFPLAEDMEKRPFGGSREEYINYLSPHFESIVFERCHNSIPPRQGTELFGIFTKRESVF